MSFLLMGVKPLQRMEILKGAYYDSVTLMLVARELNKLEGVTFASLSMGTEANYRIMATGGFDLSGVTAGPGDMIIAVLGDGEENLSKALAAAKEYLANPPWKKATSAGDYRPKSLDGAVSIQPESNLAVISVAGRYAGDIARDCIEKGLNVMLYSDNVSVEKEVEIKRLAEEKGLLVMGPDCGTVIIRGAAIGMANVCPTGPVGMVAAAGTGLQEVHVQLALRGVGTLHGIGTGGRDVKSEVGGIMMLSAIKTLLTDEEVKVLVVLGKPPAAEVEAKIIAAVEKSEKPVVLGFIGGAVHGDRKPVYLCSELEETAAVAAALAVGKDPVAARNDLTELHKSLKARAEKIGVRKGYLRGLYSGGTLCYEAQLIASSLLGDVWSNTPLKKERKLENSLQMREHSIVDYGEDEFTQGKLHPMIDVSFRCGRIAEEAANQEVGVILMDLVLGYGCHRDPASEIAEAVKKAKSLCGDRIAFVASVCGTEGDPQKASDQRKKLEDAGVHMCDSNAQATRLAAYLLGR